METPLEIVRQYVHTEVLRDADPSELADNTPLVTGGILDSLGTIKLVAFLEASFGIEIRPHEIDVDHLDTVGSIVELVGSKLEP